MIQERARAGHDRLLNDSKTVAKWRAVPEANWKILHRSSFLARDLHSRTERNTRIKIIRTLAKITM